jgi:drug/metabolite transporter (DMT)-like permease
MERWFKWTLLEAGSKVVVRALQKVLGVASAGLPGIALVIGITGLTQACMATIALRRLAVPISSFANRRGAVFFGLGAVASNLFVFGAFLNGGEVIVTTFIGTLSIIPGAFIDHFVFKHRLTFRHILGVVLGIVAGYLVLGAPSLKAFLAMPLWVWLSFGLAFSLAINQWITQSIKDIHPYEKNFWGGSATLVCAVVLMVCTGTESLSRISIHSYLFVVCAFGIGVVTFFMWAFNLFAYKDGAYISLKKLVMNASYMALVFVLGAVFFSERVTVMALMGFALYVTAIAVMDDKAWKVLRSFVSV